MYPCGKAHGGARGGQGHMGRANVALRSNGGVGVVGGSLLSSFYHEGRNLRSLTREHWLEPLQATAGDEVE